MADRRLHERITAPEYVIRGCEERVDHRGELGRDATDAHLAASLSVAVRRLAVYRSLRRDAERERVEMAVEEVGGLVANPLVPGMERLLRGGIIHQGGSFLSLPACHSLSSLSSLSFSVCRFLSDPGFPSSLSLQRNSYVLLSWGSISLFPSFSRVSFPSPLLFGFVGFNALVGVKDLLVGGWVEREFPEMSLKLLRFSSSSSLSFSSSTFLLLFLFLFHESSSFGLIII